MLIKRWSHKSRHIIRITNTFEQCITLTITNNTNFRKNPMREKIVIYRFVCDAMLKMAKPKMGVKLSDLNHAYLLDFRVCH